MSFRRRSKFAAELRRFLPWPTLSLHRRESEHERLASAGLSAPSSRPGHLGFLSLQPPHIVLNPTFGTSISDFDSSAATNVEEMTPETTPRSWWESGGPNKDVYEGFDASIEKLRDVLEADEQGFDGVMGFSQVRLHVLLSACSTSC